VGESVAALCRFFGLSGKIPCAPHPVPFNGVAVWIPTSRAYRLRRCLLFFDGGWGLGARRGSCGDIEIERRPRGASRSACLGIFSVLEIERRPRGASRGKPAPTFVATCHGLLGHSCQPCWHDPIFRLARPAPHLSSVMRQGGQPWPDWNGALQQMWERACPAKRRAGGARSQRR